MIKKAGFPVNRRQRDTAAVFCSPDVRTSCRADPPGLSLDPANKPLTNDLEASPKI